jgi:cytochrome c oxidase subunit 2
MKMSKGLIGRHLLGLAMVGLVLAVGGTAHAELGQPAPWEYSLQESATEVMDFIRTFHNWLLAIITVVTLFVLALLIIVVVKFNAKANPVPSKTTHNTLIEVAWTLIPVLILVGIAVPSFRLLFLELDVPKPDLTVKVTGKQWYWSYAYPDNGKFEFDSLLDKDKVPRLLGVDNEMVVPVNKVVRVQTTGARHQDRLGPRPSQRDLVQGHQDRHVLRPVLGAVRQGPRLHADRGAGRQRPGIRDLGRGREEEVCDQPGEFLRLGWSGGAVGSRPTREE